MKYTRYSFVCLDSLLIAAFARGVVTRMSFVFDGHIRKMVEDARSSSVSSQ